LKIGLVGVGHLGKIHLKCLKNTQFDISGFYDPDEQIQKIIQDEYGIRSFHSLEEMLPHVDCVDIVCPTLYHHTAAKKCLDNGKHIFIEKPITETLDQARELAEIAERKKLIVQVGHVERYNPAIRSLHDLALHPLFVEAHRLAVFNPRGTDVSVVLDLMIHDIDIVLSLIKAEITDIRANGVCVVSKTPDICNARVEFANGAVANFTASRISMKNMRKIRMFQTDAYISLDFLQKEAQVIKIEDDDISDEGGNGMTFVTNDGKKRLIIEAPPIMQNNAIEEELNDFYQSVVHNKSVTVTVQDGLRALLLAHLIEDKMNGNKNV
jgi:predicted dehydrogenase